MWYTALEKDKEIKTGRNMWHCCDFIILQEQVLEISEIRKS